MTPMIRIIVVLIAVILLMLVPVPPVSAAEVCCAVKAVDAKTGMVTLQDLKTGQTSQLKVDAARLKSLKVGDQVERTIGTALQERPIGTPMK